MATIQFKTKTQTVYDHDGTVAWRYVSVPRITTKHCNMDEFRNHPRYGAYANSDLFPSLIARALKQAQVGATIRTDRVPECVTIDDGGFLTQVTISL